MFLKGEPPYRAHSYKPRLHRASFLEPIWVQLCVNAIDQIEIRVTILCGLSPNSNQFPLVVPIAIVLCPFPSLSKGHSNVTIVGSE